MRRDGKGLDKGLSGSYWMGRLTARVIERASECHPPQELQMKKEIPSFYAVHPIFKWKKSGRGLERWTEMSDRDVVVTLMPVALQDNYKKM